MSFSKTQRIFAFSADLLGSLEPLRIAFGSDALTAPNSKRKGQVVKTLLCGDDRTDSDLPRGLEFGVTAVPIKLSDGRYALAGRWSERVIEAFESGDIDGAELTLEELENLKPIDEEI